jgi:hypothetical protein
MEVGIPEEEQGLAPPCNSSHCCWRRQARRSWTLPARRGGLRPPGLFVQYTQLHLHLLELGGRFLLVGISRRPQRN